MIKKELNKLFAPTSYWTASEEKKKEVANGCGPDGWKTFWGINKTFGLSIKKACNIHDWMYHFGKNQEDKDKADRVFLNNMIRIIETETSWRWLSKLRCFKARLYYLATKCFGGPAFWEGKNNPDELNKT
ncbi:DUF1353 domain-containing protein [Candidatus Peregrinibacteria bacterium]|jgi:hypothetical protein|nr:DUF1353 domain-containing protein [Candidatus Peregrinibacteria bacterium]